MKKILIINGPNLNMLGKREPEVYGSKSFEDYFNDMKTHYKDCVILDYFQSNSEGALVDRLQASDGCYDGVILNAAAYTHTSVALHDAIRGIEVPVVEVHISNPHSREPFRHHSFITAVAKGVISGFGLRSYRLAIEGFLV